MRRVTLGFVIAFAGFAAAACGGSKKSDTTPVAKKSSSQEPVQREPEAIKADVKPAEGGGAPPRDPIFFEFDAYTIREDSKPVLEKYAEYLNKNPNSAITVSGHTDDRGTTEYNLALGDQRSKAARDYLVRLGVDGARIKVISFGEERPATGGTSEDAWSRNRRAEFDTSSAR